MNGSREDSSWLRFLFVSFILVARMRCREWRKDFFFFRNVEISSFFSTSLHSNLFFLRVQFLRLAVETIQGKGCIFTERAERFKILILEDELSEDTSCL